MQGLLLRELSGMGATQTDKMQPRADLTNEELKAFCVMAVRQHRDECRLWVSLHDEAKDTCPSQSGEEAQGLVWIVGGYT